MSEVNEKQTVLIVDDSINNIKTLGEIIRTECNIIFARSGKEALSLAQKMRPDLILLDVMMPEMDGYEVCSRLKENKFTDMIPVIFVTSLDSEDDEQKGLELGAIDYIAKPFHPSIVKMRIRNHLELVRYRNQLKHLSTTDGLTGIANRRRFDDQLYIEWGRALREHDPLSLIFLDIDNFKKYNDYYGHLQGDECLRTIAQTIEQCYKRETDIVARYGGEEFAIVLPNTDLEGAKSCADKLVDTIRALALPHPENKDYGIITISIGLSSVVPNPNITPEQVLNFVDGCMYEAKETGRNKCIARAFKA
ncbi:diguanylate cyclase [Alteromonas sp. a30]|nr:diguanylate cyclase [Alteromonas sp. a30]